MARQRNRRNRQEGETVTETKDQTQANAPEQVSDGSAPALPEIDSEGRAYGKYVEIIEKKAANDERVRKDERLISAIHEAVRLGINPNAGDTAEMALARLQEEAAKGDDADLSPVVIPWLEENPVFTKEEEERLKAENKKGNAQQGHFFGVYWRRETPKDKQPTRTRTGGGTGGGANAKRLQALQEQVNQLTARVAELMGTTPEEVLAQANTESAQEEK